MSSTSPMAPATGAVRTTLGDAVNELSGAIASDRSPASWVAS